MRIERVPVDVPTRAPGGRTAAYVVGSEGCLLVDPAATDERIDERLDAVDHIAVTHHHPDHVGRVAEYAETTDATVWCRYGRTGAFERTTGTEPDRTFRDGTEIPVVDGTVTVRETPGHAPEHVGFEIDSGILIGDLAVAEGSVTVNSPEGDMRAYLTSLRRVRAIHPDRLFPAHGPVIDDPRSACERLIRHRLARERRVLSAVEAGNRTVADILDVAYEKDLTGVRDLAGSTVRAHLDKLHHEGRVRWDGSRADPVT